MFNAKRARYTEVPLYKYFLHGASVSRLPRTGEKNPPISATTSKLPACWIR